MVEGLREHVLVAAMYALAAASCLWEDRPSPPPAQAAQEGRSPGPTSEDMHHVLPMRASSKSWPVVRPAQHVGCDVMDALLATTEVHVLKHRNTWWTVEWNDNGRVRQATAQAPDDETPPPPRGGDRLRLGARVSHTPEAAREALHNALYWLQGAPGGALPQGPIPAWTRLATHLTTHMRCHGAHAGQRLLIWPTDPPDAVQAAKGTLGLVTKQIF